MKNRDKLYKITIEIQNEIVKLNLFTDISNCHPQMLMPFDWLHWKVLPGLNDEVKLNMLYSGFRFMDSPNLTYALNREKRFRNLGELLRSWDKTYETGNILMKSERVFKKRVSVSEEELLQQLHARSADESELENFKTLLSAAQEKSFLKGQNEVIQVLVDLANKRLELNMKFENELKDMGQWLRLIDICETILQAEPTNKKVQQLLQEAKQKNK